MSVGNPAGQQRIRAAVVERGGGRDRPVDEGGGVAGNDERRGGIEQDGFAIGAALALEQTAERVRIMRRVAAADRVDRMADEPCILGRDAAWQLRGTDACDDAVASARQLSSPSSPDTTNAASVPSCSSASA